MTDMIEIDGSFVDERLTLFEQAGIRIDLLQSDSLALHNHFSYEGRLQTSQPHEMSSDGESVAIVDVGSNTTNFLVNSPEGIWFHSAGLGSEKINRSLARQFGVTVAEAERLKRSPSSARDLRQWHDAAREVFENLMQEILWSLSMFAKVHPKMRVGRILGTGGGFQTHGLLRYLYHGR